MAKKNHSHAPETKKKPGAGAVFGSVILFIVTLLLSVLLMLSTSLHLMLKNHAPSHALSEIALSQIQIDGQSFGSWFYTCYLWNAEGLNPAYGESVVAHPEFRAFFQNHLSDIEHYYLKETDDIPELSADALFDLMQNGNGIANDLKQQTGITLNDTHREAFLYNAEEDVADWNAAIAGNSFTRGMLRFLCSLPGVITVGVLTGVIFLLWLFLAIAGGWRKGRMLTGSGCAIAIPNLLVLLGCGVMLLLVSALDCIPRLSFAKTALPVLTQPFLWGSGIVALCGMILASIGICANSIVKSKRHSPIPAQPTDPAQPVFSEFPAEPVVPAAPAVPETPIEPSISAAPESLAEPMATPTAAPVQTAVFCPHCGAKLNADDKFCGSCGGTLL